jgi:hypothetical protein
MKNPLLSLGAALGIGVVLLNGCASSQAARIQEKSAVFQTLTPKQQHEIRAQKVKVGFTPDMVYMAIGKPTSVKVTHDQNGSGEEWNYSHFVVHPDTLGFENPEISSDNASGMNQGSDRYAPKQVPLPTEEGTLTLRFRGGQVDAVETH